MKARTARASLFSDQAFAEAVWGRQRRPRPVDHHTSTEAAGFWGPRCSKLDPWLHRKVKPTRTLGPRATVSVLGTGVPILACLWPAAWRSQQAVRPIFSTNHSRPSRGAKPREADDTKASSGAVSLGLLPRSGDIYARDTSRGSRDISHDDQGQAGTVYQFPLWC